MSFTTTPNPLISNSPGTLTYIDYTYTPVHNNIYALRNSQNIQVPNSSTYTSSINNFNNNTFQPLLSSLTNDGNGNFYFGENNTGNIYQYILSSNTFSIITNIGGVSKISLTYYNGYLYIGNWSTNTIDKYDVSVNPPTKTTFASGTNINQPNGLVFNNLGELYIANHGSGRIVKYVSSTNTYTVLPTNPSTISQPYGLALDSNSNLYIASWDTYVYKYNVTTQTTSIYFQDTVDVRVQPYGLVFDSYDNLYVTSFNWMRVYKVYPNQTFTIIIPYGSLGGRPTGMTIYNNTIYFLTNNDGNSVPWRLNNYNLFLYFSNLILDTSQTLTVYNNANSQVITSLNVVVEEETEYISENINLFSIFAPIPEGYTGPYADETYIINKNRDLNQLFLPYTPGSLKAPLTNYHTIKNSTIYDISDIFQSLISVSGFTINTGYTYNFVNNYYTFTFLQTASGTITFNKNIQNLQYLIVAGGGNGGTGNSSTSGGGGGGGGVVYGTSLSLNSGTYNVVVGAPVSDSRFNNFTASRGGNGANGSQSAGGSGGIAGSGGGNGGAGNGTVGSNGSSITIGNNPDTFYGGGGGGGAASTFAAGGLGGGGTGGLRSSSSFAPTSGQINTGGGGGGGGRSNGASGGSGIVILYFTF